MSTNTGRVVWHDLMTNDAEKAQGFYTELFGWQVEEVDLGMGPYKKLKSGDTEIGGIVGMAPEQQVPPHWIAYVAVDDADAAAERAKASGGEVAWEPMEIPNVGKFAIIKDPTGGHIAPFQSVHPAAPEREGPPPAGQFCWEELLTTDPEGAAAFYGELFGWSVEAMDMGEIGTYRIFKRGEFMEGGTMKMPPQAQHLPHWLSYIAVDDVDATAAKAAELGAQQFVAPQDIPNIGRFAVLADPTGGAFAVFKGHVPPG